MVDEEELNHASTALLLTENERQYCFEDRQSVYILEKVGSSKILPLWGLAFYRFLSFAYLLSVPFIWEWVDFPSADVPHFLLFLTQWGIMFAVIYFGAAFSGCGIAYYGFAKQRRNSIHYFSSLAPSLGLFLQLLERLQALALVLEFSITILFWAVLYPQIDHSWCGIRCFSAHGIGTFLLLIDFGLNHLSLEARHLPWPLGAAAAWLAVQAVWVRALGGRPCYPGVLEMRGWGSAALAVAGVLLLAAVHLALAKVSSSLLHKAKALPAEAQQPSHQIKGGESINL